MEVQLDFHQKSEVQESLDRLRDLINSRILWEEHNLIYRRSVLTEVLIILKQLLIKASKLNNRISFTEDRVADENWGIVDITHLISFYRDAACHSDSAKLKEGTIVSSFNESRGATAGIDFGKNVTPTPYEDEITFLMGGQRLYLHRHIERAYQELESFFRPLIFM